MHRGRRSNSSSPFYFEEGVKMNIKKYSRVIKYFVAAIFLFALLITFYFDSASYPVAARRFPRVLIYVIGFLTILMVVEQVIKFKKEKGSTDDENTPGKTELNKSDEEKEKEENNWDYKNSLIYLLIIGLYIFSIGFLGYFAATFSYILVIFLYLKSTDIKKTIFIAVGVNLFLYLVFVYFLNIRIPMGIFA